MIRGEFLSFKPNLNRAIVHIYEDISGGAVLYKAELKNGPSGVMPEGCLLSLVSGIAHLTKSASLWDKVKSDATGIYLNKANEFKPGDNISDSLFRMTARRIIDIDRSDVSYDFVSIGSGFNVSGWSNMVMVETLASGTSGVNSSLRYTPTAVGMSETPLDLSRINSGFALMVRGTCREGNLPFPVDENLKAYLPLIRFVDQ